MKLNLPTWLTVVLAAAAGVIVAFNEASFAFATNWRVGITVALTILAAWGISPLTGAAFRVILHLSNTVAAVIAMALAVLQVIFLQVSMSPDVHGLVAGVIVFAAGLGFAPAAAVVVAGATTGRKGLAS
jgi:hypothetical protein